MLGNRPQLQTGVAQELSPHLLTVVRLLQMDMAALSDYLLDVCEQNPALEYVEPIAVRPAPRVYRNRRSGKSYDISDPAAAIENVAGETSPIESLRRQLRLYPLKPRPMSVCLDIIASLDEAGFFGRDLDEFAASNNITAEQARKCLRVVQSLDPAGVGARNLSECLLIQLKRAGLDDPLTRTIIKEHLCDALKRGCAKIAAETGASVAAVRRSVGIIGRLDPRPCDLRQEATVYVSPDYAVETDETGKLTIVGYDEYYPAIKLDRGFAEAARGLSGADRDFARRATASARQIIRAVETRRVTMQAILNVVVREQRGFFKGECQLMPLRCEAIAGELGVHESTVYRCIAGKHIHCGKGTFPLGYFLQRSCGSLTSEARAKEIIRALCREDKRLSDREISEILERQGVSVARRTVAKYRRQMSISSSYERTVI